MRSIVVAKLKNPPLVEVWFGLDVETNPDGQPWSLGIVEEFLSRYRDELSKGELEHSLKVVLEKSQHGLPRRVGETIQLDRVKVFDEERTRCLQVSNGRIVYNSLRKGKDYPGYDEVYSEAERKFADYIDFFRPLSIRDASLSYVDIINIPIKDTPTLELTDYFRMGTDLPEDPFGAMSQYTVQSVFKCPVDEGPLIVTLRSLPAHPEQKYFRFHMEWQKHSVRFESLDLDVVRRRLKTSKDYISTCFQQSFTEVAWKLFEPESTIE
jgi:uncharacterized protein (TIGR04255 family)